MVDVALVSVTVLSLTLAAIMAVITWRIVRLDRRRSGVRVAELSAAAALAPEPETVADVRVPDGAATESEATGTRWFVPAFVAGALILAAVLGSHVTARRLAPATSARAPMPLELLAVEPSRDGDRIQLRGLIRNPADGQRCADLVAVVEVFDRTGASGGVVRSPLREPTLAPGGESGFDVPLGAGPSVARYRLTFESGSVPVRHVDRRHVAGAGADATDDAAREARRDGPARAR